jgi:hypothetical protein
MIVYSVFKNERDMTQGPYSGERKQIQFVRYVIILSNKEQRACAWCCQIAGKCCSAQNAQILAAL